MTAQLLPEIPSGLLEVSVAWGADLSDTDGSGWTWTDITGDVRADPGISTFVGRNDEASASQPATCSLTLDNTGGAYSLGGWSPNWPNVRRGLPVRVRVNPGDGGGYRVIFQGFTDTFTPSWDDGPGGRAPVVELSASGVLRRLGQGAAPIRSPYRRVMSTTSSVKAYWPMEDGKNATTCAPAVGNAIMRRWGDVDMAADSDSWPCSTGLPTVGEGGFTALVPTYTGTGENQVRWLLTFPDSLTTDVVLAYIWTTGGISRWDLVCDSFGGFRLYAYNADGSFNSDSGFTGFDDYTLGKAVRVSVELVQSGGNIATNFSVLGQQGLGVFWNGFTVASKTIGVVTRVELFPQDAPAGFDVGATIGHLTVQNEQTDTFEGGDQLAAFAGELNALTGGRMLRLAGENNIPLDRDTLSDLWTLADNLGPQSVGTLVDLLRECETLDGGQLYDGLGPGLRYVLRRFSETRTTADLTIDAAAGQLAPPFDPTDDDQRLRNVVTASRTDGSEVTVRDDTGPMGAAAVGVYAASIDVNAYNDGQLGDIAAWQVAKGTATGYRVPTVSVDLRATPTLAAAVVDLRPGMRVDVLSPGTVLEGLGVEPVPLLVEGIAHDLGPRHWRVTLKCSPYGPWMVGTVAAASGDTGLDSMRLRTAGATVSSFRAAGATTLPVATSTGPLWTTVADDYPLYLDVGGVRVRATACSGVSSPQTFTVDALPVARAAGLPVDVWAPPGPGL